MAETTQILGSLIINRGPFDSDKSYYKDNVVQHNGSSYICLAKGPISTSPGTDTTNWSVFAAKGQDGQGGGGTGEIPEGYILYKDGWDDGLTYKKDDVVYHAEKLYRCKQDVGMGYTPGDNPEYWEVFSVRDAYTQYQMGFLLMNSPKFKAWDPTPSTTYSVGDITLVDNDYWVCLQQTSGGDPIPGDTGAEEYWREFLPTDFATLFTDFATKSEVDENTTAINELSRQVATHQSNIADLQGNKQEQLISGTNIKTINGVSLLGSGNIVIEGGAGGEQTPIEGYTKEQIDDLIKSCNKYKGAFSPSTTYKKNDIVGVSDGNYICLAEEVTGSTIVPDEDTNQQYWAPFSVLNVYTRDEVNDLIKNHVNFREWNPSASYKKNDIVGLNDGFYICVSDVDGSTIDPDDDPDVTYWRLFSLTDFSAILNGYATQSWVEEQGFLTEHQDISGKLDTATYNTEKENFATKAEVSAVDEKVAAKQDKLTAGTGVEITPNGTINVLLDNELFTVVSALPTSGVSNKIYLVPASESETNDAYIEYGYVGGSWERLGQVKGVNLEQYYTKTTVDGLLEQKADKSTVDNLLPRVTTLEGKASSHDTSINTLMSGQITQAEQISGINTSVQEFDLLVGDKAYSIEGKSGLARKNFPKDSAFNPTNVSAENTIYIIQYVYDLGGGNVNIPKNCVLYFDGGKLVNGTVTGNHTLVAGSLVDILDNVVLNGTWANSECNLVWWGCKIGAGIDNSPNINSAFRSSIPTIRVSRGYFMSSPVELPYNKIIIGRSGLNNMLSGFRANTDFTPKSVDFPARGGKQAFTQTVYGMFYHRDATDLWMKDIFINANHHADFCIEHIDLYGSADLENCYIASANKVGVLQYATEYPKYIRTYITDCPTGMLISAYNIPATYPFKPLTDSWGSLQGQPNLVYTNGLRILGCNYGVIVKGASNGIFESLETAHNSIAGLILIGGVFEMNNYYTEGDAECVFWIDANGVKTTSDGSERGNRGLSLPFLVSNGLDGFSICEEDPEFKEKVYYRAPIFVQNADININSAFMSIKPRKYNVASDTQGYDLPTNREAGGVDAFYITKNAQLKGRNIMEYKLNNNYDTSYLYSCVVDFPPETYSINVSHIDLDLAYWKNNETNRRIKVANYWRPGANKSVFKLDGNNYSGGYLYNLGKTAYPDYNYDVETTRYGNNMDLDFRTNQYIETYNQIPLYKPSSFKHILLYKNKFLKKFGNTRSFKVVCYVKYLSDISDKLNIRAQFYDGNGTVHIAYYDDAGNQTISAGYYKYTLLVDVPQESTEWTYMIFQCQITNGSPLINLENVLFSDMFFYAIDDAEEKPYIYKSVYLPSGPSANRPVNPVIGTKYYDTSLSKDIYWGGVNWVESDGVIAGTSRAGATTSRPNADNVPIGFCYLDATLGKPIWNNAGDWVDSAGQIV